tara:strand:- start:327 stop:512 length:186 start_codon:yes stop_codon:yes gene_type:complete
MKNQLLRIIAVAVVASIVLISWMKSRSDANADYESNKVEINDSLESSSSEVSYISFDEAKV